MRPTARRQRKLPDLSILAPLHARDIVDHDCLKPALFAIVHAEMPRAVFVSFRRDGIAWKVRSREAYA
jgi:hypothetical protein